MNSLTNIQELPNLWGFSLLLATETYFPFIRSYSGINKTINYFNFIKQDIFNSKKVTGDFKEITFFELEQILKTYFTWTRNEDNIFFKLRDKNLIEARFHLFFETIKACYLVQGTTIQKIYIYIPIDTDDYFLITTLWSFCFILENEFGAFVTYGKTWNNLNDCPSESNYENVWRNRVLQDE